MQNKKLLSFIFALVILLIIGMGMVVFAREEAVTEVIFMNVGQGDAVLIQHGSKQILIDGGKDGKLLLERLGQFIPFYDRHIEVIIGTHNDADHIGGLVSAMESYTFDHVFYAPGKEEGDLVQAFITRREKAKEGSSFATTGTTIRLDDDVFLEVVSDTPSPDISDRESNDVSIVAKLVVGEEVFLFTGDLPDDEEMNIVSRVGDIDVLNVAHHGSKHSTTSAFLDVVQPEEAVISVGQNSYGHPTQEVMTRLLEEGTRIFRTDEEGSIRYRCMDVCERDFVR